MKCLNKFWVLESLRANVRIFLLTQYFSHVLSSINHRKYGNVMGNDREIGLPVQLLEISYYL